MQNPIRTILDVQNPANPFEVLGLPLRHISDSEVVDALAARMQQVSSHAMSETPEGNEVRLAIHAAAAQLLDARIKQALYDRAGLTAEPVVPAACPPEMPLGPRAMTVIASEGGWNPHALRKLAMIAHADGIPSSAIPQAVLSLVGGNRPVQQTADEPRKGRSPRLRDVKKSGDTLQLVVTAFLAGAAILAIGVTWVMLASGKPAEIATTQAPTESSNPGQSTPGMVAEGLDEDTPPEEQIPRPIEPNSEEPDWTAALIGFRDAGEQVDALTLERLLDGLAAAWPDQDAEATRRVVSGVVDLVYLMETQQSVLFVQSAAGRIRDGGPATASFYAGVLARLAVERSMPTQLDNAIVSALVSTIGTGYAISENAFERGVAGGLEHESASWLSTAPDRGDREAWFTAADALTRMDAGIGSMLIRSTTDAMLRSGVDHLGSDRGIRTLEMLAARLQPDVDRESAGLVLSLLADRDVSTRSLSVLVNAISRQPASVESQFPRLPPIATASERASVRDQLAALWSQGQADSAEQGVIEIAIRDHLARDPGGTPAEHLVDCVASARLVNLCHAVLWGTADQAVTTIDAIRSDLDNLLSASASSAPTMRPSQDNEAWVLRYLEARRNIPVRQSLLSEMSRNTAAVGPITAELLVSEAVNGTPARVRRDAQAAVEVLADQPAVINAMIEVLPTAPRVQSVQGLVERVAATSLPSIQDPSWLYNARQSLVERLLSTLSEQGAYGAIDELSDLLETEYSDRITQGTAPGSSSVSQLLVEQRTAEIQRVDLSGQSFELLNESRRVLAGRRLLARGTAMEFAAHQVTATELLAELVSLEQPHLRPEIDEVIQGMHEDRAAASSVFAQMAVVERATLQLWVLRIGATL